MYPAMVVAEMESTARKDGMVPGIWGGENTQRLGFCIGLCGVGSGTQC